MVGKTIITSDHGNLFGERIKPLYTREYGHPCGIYSKQLIKIPWLVTTNAERKEIQGGNINDKREIEEIEKDEIAKKLNALGYIDYWLGINLFFEKKMIESISDSNLKNSKPIYD